MYKIKLEKFEGPLDLLLQLIEEEEMDITELALAKVAEQFIKYVYENGEIHPRELADFLVIASKLLLLKSKALLPYLQWEEEDEEDLTKQLKIYKEYLEASKVVQKIISKKRFTYSREKPPQIEEVKFTPPVGQTKFNLHDYFVNIIKGLEKIVKIPKGIIKKTISIQEKISQIRDRIQSQAQFSFKSLLSEAKDRTELIVSFLALLELVKQQTVVVRQNELFTDIEIEKVSNLN